MKKVVLVTGGSRGIGAAIAKRLVEAGDIVYAASRSGKAPEGAIPLVMDVNDEEVVLSSVQSIITAEGRLDAVVVNAGNGIAGPMESFSDADVRYQFETCFFGAIKTINACIPHFRRQGSGRIVAVTSFAALAPLPYQGMYSSAKAALEMAMMDYAVELKPFGIQCGCVLPGDTATGFTAARTFTSLPEDSPYKDRFKRCIDKISKDELGGVSPDVVAKAVQRQLERRRMKLEVIPGLDYGLLALLVKCLPQRTVNWVMGLLYNS